MESPNTTIHQMPSTSNGVVACEAPSGDGVSSPTPLSPSSIKSTKKLVLSCRIVAHTIQKCTSPKKNALDPLRYMPERASFLAQFTLAVQFEDRLDEHQVFRSYTQFSTLHTKLQKKFPKSKLPKQLPSMRKKRYDNEYIEDKSQQLNEYLRQLLELPEVKACRVLREFLEDSTLSDDSDEEDALPLKVLEGLPGTIVTLRAGQSFSVTLDLQRPGDVASWQFTTKKHNIGFSATFNGEVARVYSREEAHVKPVKGSFKCTESGTLTLDWDNTYTWSNTKVLVYWAEVEQTRVLVSPLSEGLSSLYSPNSIGSPATISDATPMLVDGRRSGFIAQTRTPSLYPRSIMNSSINLITKSFIGKPDQAEFKSGLLIIERNVQFRGRQWYRKWFVLDTHKCVLRYYDSEAAARKGLSLGTMHLTAKYTSLAITSQNEAAPTPYLFMVRARNRCWKICSSTLTEHTEWEHAISTAILTAQQKQMHGEDGPSYGNSDHGGNKGDVDSSMSTASIQRVISRTGTERSIRERDAMSDDSEDDEDEDESEEEVQEMEVGNSIVPMPVSSSGNDPERILTPFKATPTVSETDHNMKAQNQFSSRPLRVPTTSDILMEQLETTSFAKKILFIIWINSMMLALRSTTTAVVASMTLVVNAYFIVHVVETRASIHK